MSRRYEYLRDGVVHGPVTGKELYRLAATGQLGPDDLIRSVKPGATGRWMPARKARNLPFGQARPRTVQHGTIGKAAAETPVRPDSRTEQDDLRQDGAAPTEASVAIPGRVPEPASEPSAILVPVLPLGASVAIPERVPEPASGPPAILVPVLPPPAPAVATPAGEPAPVINLSPRFSRPRAVSAGRWGCLAFLVAFTVSWIVSFRLGLWLSRPLTD